MKPDVDAILSVCLSGGASGRSYMIVLPEGVRRDQAIRRGLAARHERKTGAAELRILAPKDGIIGVDAARELSKAAAGSGSTKRGTTIAILEADAMTRPAANALLKLLEEPPAGTRFVLTTDRPHVMPATIISRMLRFIVAPSDDLLLDELAAIDSTGATNEKRKLALAMTGKNPESAGRLLVSGMLPWLEEVRSWLEAPRPGERPEVPEIQSMDGPMLRHALQVLMRDTILGADGGTAPGFGLSTWKVSQAWDGFRMLNERAADIDRRSLDTEVRAHALLTELAHIRMESA